MFVSIPKTLEVKFPFTHRNLKHAVDLKKKKIYIYILHSKHMDKETELPIVTCK